MNQEIRKIMERIAGCRNGYQAMVEATNSGLDLNPDRPVDGKTKRIYFGPKTRKKYGIRKISFGQ